MRPDVVASSSQVKHARSVMGERDAHGVCIAGLGVYLPGPALSPEAVRRAVRSHPDGLPHEVQERILADTGIRARHYAIDAGDRERRESNTTLAAEAGRRALANAGWTPKEVDLLVVTTVVPDHLMPPTSTLVQEALAIPDCIELEISANCSGPYKGLMVAIDALRSGRCRRALVCSSQYVSFLGSPPWANPEAMKANQGHLRWILSDGAGAWALTSGTSGADVRAWSSSGGVGKRSGMTLPLGAASPDLANAYARGTQHVTQDMRYVLKSSLRFAVESFGRMCRDLDIDAARIDHFIPSVSSMQVAAKFQELFARQCGLPPERWRLDYRRVGYLGGVQFPVAMAELVDSGVLRPGDLVCSFAEESSKWMCAGAIVRWQG